VLVLAPAFAAGVEVEDVVELVVLAVLEDVEVLATTGVDFAVGVVDVAARVVDCFAGVLLCFTSLSGHSTEASSPRKTIPSNDALSALTLLQAALICNAIWLRPLIQALEHSDPGAKSLVLQLGICLLYAAAQVAGTDT
jgi:hypothetical protein